MSRTIVLAALVALLAVGSDAPGDTVTLTDGRVLTGAASEQDGQVTIETVHGTVTIGSQRVLSIEHSPTAEAELAERLQQVRPNDPEGLYQLGAWAADHGLIDEAQEFWRQVIEINHGHVGARRALGHVRLGRRWMDYELAMQTIESRIAAGMVEQEDLAGALDELAPMVRTAEERLRMRSLEAMLLLRQRRFAEAYEAFAALAGADVEQSQGQTHRWRAVAEVLAANPDGMYVLAEPFPPESALLREPGAAVLPAGPASLAEPITLAAALRDKAKDRTDRGRRLLRDGREHELTDPESALELYLQAEQQFEIAHAIAPGIARSYRVEIARRRIAILRRRCDSRAGRFDAEMATLGRQSMPERLYRNKLQRMVRNLDEIQDDLEQILQLCRRFDEELILESRWAQLDRQRIDSMISTLRQELDETPVGRAP